MRIRIIWAIPGDEYHGKVLEDALQYKSPDTDLDVVGTSGGLDSLKSFYDEAVQGPFIVEKVVEAEKDGYDGVFISCFADPAVEASRLQVRIPVVGAFQPTALTASLISRRWSVVTVLPEVIPMIRRNARNLGIEKNIASIRHVNMHPIIAGPEDVQTLEQRSLSETEKAVDEDGAQLVALGCTAMIGLAEKIAREMAAKGKLVSVLDPTACAIGYLELLIRNGIWQKT